MGPFSQFFPKRTLARGVQRNTVNSGNGHLLRHRQRGGADNAEACVCAVTGAAATAATGAGAAGVEGSRCSHGNSPRFNLGSVLDTTVHGLAWSRRRAGGGFTHVKTTAAHHLVGTEQVTDRSKTAPNVYQPAEWEQ